MNSFDPQLLQKLSAHALSVLAEQEDEPAITSTSSEVAPAAKAQPIVPQTVGDMKSTAFAALARGIKTNVFIGVGSLTYKVEAVSEEFVTARLWVKGGNRRRRAAAHGRRNEGTNPAVGTDPVRRVQCAMGGRCWSDVGSYHRARHRDSFDLACRACTAFSGWEVAAADGPERSLGRAHHEGWHVEDSLAVPASTVMHVQMQVSFITTT